jgi:acyl carrier protein
MSISSNSEVEATIKRLIIDLCPGGAAGMTEQSSLTEDLGYHSLALVELAFALEDSFDLDPIDRVTAMEIRTVGDVLRYVSGKVAERGSLAEMSA